MSENWNLDRKPTSAERATGIVAAALLCAAGGAALWFSIVVLRSVWASAASGTFTVLFAFVLIRFSSAKAQKPPRSQMLATAWAVIAVGIIMLVSSFFAGEHGARLALTSLGVTGLVGGISNLARAKKEPSQPPEPMPLKRHGSPWTLPKNTVIRLIESKDLKEVFDVRAATRENPFSRDALRKIGITEESTARALGTTHRGWLCEEEGRIVGFAIGDGGTGELAVIAVLPEFEGRGIGSRLLAAVEAWLVSMGREELWLWTSPDPKTRAFSFYLQHGWTVSESKADRIHMRKKGCPSAGAKGQARTNT